MSGYNNYEAHPADLERANQKIEGLVEAPKQAKANFERLEREVLGWNGQDDEVFKKSNPQYLAQNEGCLGVLDGLVLFLSGLQAATLESQRSIGLVQGAVQEKIDEARTNADEYGAGGNGKR